MFWKFGRRWNEEKHSISRTQDEMALLRAAPRKFEIIVPRYIEELILEGDILPSEVSTLVWDIKSRWEKLPELRTIRVTEVDIDHQGALHEMKFRVDICARAKVTLESRRCADLIQLVFTDFIYVPFRGYDIHNAYLISRR